MSNLYKSKQYDLIDMLNVTYRYLNDIFTIDNPDFEKHIPMAMPTGEHCWKKIVAHRGLEPATFGFQVYGAPH